jgi:hypothetical protein
LATKKARAISDPGFEVGRSREERGEAGNRGEELSPAKLGKGWWGTPPDPASSPRNLIVVGALAMAGEIQPFAFGFFARAQTDGLVEDEE